MKRFFDIIMSLFLMVIFLPLIMTIAIVVKIDSRGPVFFIQKRVGKGGKDFRMFKFRTMCIDADKKGLLTVGNKDKRITGVGYFLRKYKLDELPQLFNVLNGTMSMVGPRPEVRKYVELYDSRQKKVLDVLPGITDMASLIYINENELLAKSPDPEEMYVSEIMPAKLELNLSYLANRTLRSDFNIILKTFLKSFFRK